MRLADIAVELASLSPHHVTCMALPLRSGCPDLVPARGLCQADQLVPRSMSQGPSIAAVAHQVVCLEDKVVWCHPRELLVQEALQQSGLRQLHCVVASFDGHFTGHFTLFSLDADQLFIFAMLGNALLAGLALEPSGTCFPAVSLFSDLIANVQEELSLFVPSLLSIGLALFSGLVQQVFLCFHQTLDTKRTIIYSIYIYTHVCIYIYKY